MEKINILVGGVHYKVELAQTDEEKEKGLQGKTSLEPNTGMLFIFSEDEIIEGPTIWMQDTNIPLDIVFIDDELEVISVRQGEPQSEELISEPNAAFVLEINVNSGIKPGDELEFSPKDKQVKSSYQAITKKEESLAMKEGNTNEEVRNKMLVLNSGGEVQMELDGEERIFSRAHTKTLIKFAKKAATINNDNGYKNVGKRVFKFLDIQENNEAEYVPSKK